MKRSEFSRPEPRRDPTLPDIRNHMPALFSTAAKLLGVLLTYWGLTALAAALLAGAPGFTLLSAVLAFVFAFVLVFRTEWLAQRVGAGAGPSFSAAGLEPRALLRTGIILIGLYAFLFRLATALAAVNIYFSGVRFEGFGSPLVRAVIECIPLLIAPFFVFQADRVAELITRWEAKTA